MLFVLRIRTILFSIMLFVVCALISSAQEAFLDDYNSIKPPQFYQKAWDEFNHMGQKVDTIYFRMMQTGRGFSAGDRVVLAVKLSQISSRLANGLYVVLFNALGVDDGTIGLLYSDLPKAVRSGADVAGVVFARYQGALEGIPILIPDVSIFPRNVWAASTQNLKSMTLNTLGKLALLPLKLAIIAPLSGRVPTFGVSTRDGALLAIDQWNSKGGVLGMRITPIIEDGQCTPDPAVKAANKVIDQDKVHYIVGEVCSKASIPISDIANAAKVIQISPTSTNTGLTVDKSGATKAYVFRACFIDPFQGKVGAIFAFRNLRARKAFVMFDPNNDYTRGLAEAFTATFSQLGGSIVAEETYAYTDTDFSSILDQIEKSLPDVIYLPDYYNIVNLVAKQAKEKGITTPFLGGDGWDSSDLDKDAVDGGYYTNHYSQDDPRPEVQNFLKVYGEKYKDPSGRPIVPDALAALGYDATNLLLQAIQNAGADNPDKVRAALERISFNAVSGLTTFDAQHNPIKGAVILHVRDGKVEFDSFLDVTKVAN